MKTHIIAQNDICSSLVHIYDAYKKTPRDKSVHVMRWVTWTTCIASFTTTFAVLAAFEQGLFHSVKRDI